MRGRMAVEATVRVCVENATSRCAAVEFSLFI